LSAAAAAPAVVEAQARSAPQAQEQATRSWGQRVPLERLQQLRAELNLSDDQVVRLQAVGERLRQQNAPLVEQLRASGAWQRERSQAGQRARMTPEQRQQLRQRWDNMSPDERDALRQRMQERRRGAQAAGAARGPRQLPEELRPTAQQIRANTRGAMQEARAVLTAEQQMRLREIVRERRGSSGEGRAQRRGSRSGR
jgi:hypothetical protein